MVSRVIMAPIIASNPIWGHVWEHITFAVRKSKWELVSLPEDEAQIKLFRLMFSSAR